MKAKIKTKEEIAEGTLLVTYDLLGKKISFKPGQYFFISLIHPPYIDKRGNRRHFTFVNSPTQNDITMMATRIRNSGFKKSLAALPIGSEVKIGPIEGTFTLPQDTNRAIIFITGGIGITPFISMLRFIKEKKLDYKITLIYSNRNKASAAFLEELKQFDRFSKNFKLILSMTEDPSWRGEKRMIDAQFIKDYIEDPNSYTFMFAGPQAFNEAVYKALKKAGVEDKNIIGEDFSGY